MMFKALLTWIDRQQVTLDDISRLQWKYARAIKQEIAEMEKAYHAGNIQEQERRMTRAQGYYKKAQSLIKEGK